MRAKIEKCFDWWFETEAPFSTPAGSLLRLRDRLLCEFADEHEPQQNSEWYGFTIGLFICKRCRKVLPAKHTCGECGNTYVDWDDLREHLMNSHGVAEGAKLPEGTKSELL